MPKGVPKEKHSSEITAEMKQAIKMSVSGLKESEIARKLGVDAKVIADWFLRDDVVALRASAAKKMVTAMCMKAYKVLGGQLDNGNPWIQLNAAREIIRLSDTYNAQDQSQVTVSFGNMPSPGSPQSADDEVEAAADQTFNAG